MNSPPPPANPVGSLTGLCAHLRTSWEHRDTSNVVLVHYRNLERHLEPEMRRIADALGITVDKAAWASLVRAAEFEAMRSHAEELVPEVHVPGVWHDNQKFFHTGTSGQWRTLLSGTDLAHYQQRLDELDIASDFRGWLHDGRLPNQSARRGDEACGKGTHRSERGRHQCPRWSPGPQAESRRLGGKAQISGDHEFLV